ncbi:MAG: HupE/UreJ family protein [Acidimicrobiia bacterium]
MNRRLCNGVIVGAISSVCFGAVPAAAHTGGPISGLSSGLLHPFLGVDHLFAMVTVGILAVTWGRLVTVPATFLAAMATGGALGIVGLALPFGEAAIALSVVALGAALVAGQTLRPNYAIGMVALAGLVHGHAHGAEAPDAAHPVVYVTGFVLATAALHLAGVASGNAMRTRPATRAAIGALVFGLGAGLLAPVI